MQLKASFVNNCHYSMKQWHTLVTSKRIIYHVFSGHSLLWLVTWVKLKTRITQMYQAQKGDLNSLKTRKCPKVNNDIHWVVEFPLAMSIIWHHYIAKDFFKIRPHLIWKFCKHIMDCNFLWFLEWQHLEILNRVAHKETQPQ